MCWRWDFADSQNHNRCRTRKEAAQPERPLAVLFRQIFVEEHGQLAKMLLGLGRVGIAGILRMRLAFEHVKIRDDSGLPQLAVYAHGVGQEQITRARREDGGWETGEVAIDRRQLRIPEVMA